MRYGTSHFVSHAAAVRYYRDYEGADASRAVQRKLAAGEIHIGKPRLKPGERLHVIDSGTRYAIEEAPAKNPKIKLPSTWTRAQVRVNSKGQVQLKMNPGDVGKGKFAKCVAAVESKGGAYDPKAVCAAMERRKYGKKVLQTRAARGLRRAIRKAGGHRPKAKTNPGPKYEVSSSHGGYIYSRHHKLSAANDSAKRESYKRPVDVWSTSGGAMGQGKVVAHWNEGRKT